ncbi:MULTISPECIES: plasmid transfer protein TraA [Streptomyces]|uniref:plasmid transfer protein TraA n=1 Tax=Streptomyces TaxID=1883 RepID=UPI000B9ED93A|nr:plasmid transfer protein TraA [Streptomyces kasugaensis]
MTFPPRPTTPPSAGTKHITKNRNGGGFNPSINPSLTIGMPGTKSAPAAAAGPAPSARGGSVPGADFMSNEEIQKFCEYLRKEARTRATERALDADHLEAVLSAIPDLSGALGGARARARRVSRHLKRVAAAEKNIQKYLAATYATFEREFDSELRKIGKGRIQPPKRTPFGWR